MIRYIHCLRKRQDISDEEFRRFWKDKRFDDLIRRVVKLSGADRHAKNLGLRVAATMRIIHDRGESEPYDGVLEYWWRDARDLMAIYESPAAQALLREILAYEKQFIDIHNSTGFFAECDFE